jgi:hypothetical protein
MATEHERYLGDGVYASFDGWSIWLDLRAQGPERICLEPEVLANLIEFALALGWKPKKETHERPR